MINFDSVTGVEYRQDWFVADAPQERGAFTSYDKVGTPFEVRVTFVSGGSLSNRQALLRTIKRIAGDLNLYDVVTPEETYLNCNVSHYGYRRAEGEAGLIEVTVHLVEIRDTGEAALSSTGQPESSAPTAQPDGAQPQNGGQVQTTDTPVGQQAVVQAAFKAPTGTVVTAGP